MISDIHLVHGLKDGVQISNSSQTFSSAMQAASKEENLESKTKLYNEIFKTLCENVKKLPSAEYLPQLFQLLEAYATSTCYNQVFNQDTGEGFKRSARLMELSLCLQLEHLNLFCFFDFDWIHFKSLEELVQSLAIEKEQPGKFFSIFNDLKIDKDSLHQAAYKQNMGESVKNSLIRLAFSYQNIENFNRAQESNIRLHTRLNELAGKFLENAPKEKAEFAYNREPFMVRLKEPKNVDALIKCYQSLLPLFKQVLGEFEYKRKEAQILNMLGIILNQNKLEPEVALNYFKLADQIHSELLKEAGPDELATQKFLSANVKSSLVANLCVAGQVDQATVHFDALEDYLRELDQNNDSRTYRGSYETAIKMYKQCILNFQVV